MAEWYEVKEMIKDQQKSNEDYDRGNINNCSDAHSYRLLYEGKENSAINQHNALGTQANIIAISVYKIIKKYSPLKSIKLADLGGGCGFIAGALKGTDENLDIYSYDLQEYGILYGKEHFPDVNFICKAIDVDDVFEEGKFDTILAYEFYPFTRNSDWEYQKSYIDMCLNNLNKDGLLLIGFASNSRSNSIGNNEKMIKECYKDKYLGKSLVPYMKVYNLCKNHFIAKIVSSVLSVARGKHYILILQK